MLFYLLIVPALAFMAYQISKQYKLRAHDQVLFGFCQVRREIMRELRQDYLQEEGSRITKTDHEALVQLLKSVSEIVHFYNRFKNHFASVRKVQIITIHSAAEEKKLIDLFRKKHSSNPLVTALFESYYTQLGVAVFEFVPWVKSRVGLTLLRLRVFSRHSKLSKGKRSKKQVAIDNCASPSGSTIARWIEERPENIEELLDSNRARERQQVNQEVLQLQMA